MKQFLIFVLYVICALVKTQEIPLKQSDQIFGQKLNVTTAGTTTTAPTAATTTTAPTVTTTSPQYLSCFLSCPSTMEYNPVCGTDSQNYHNVGRLGCAQRCGKNVAALRSGICTS